MNWRQFKTDSEGFKGFKGFKPPEAHPIKPLKPLKPARGILKDGIPATEEELFDMIRQTVNELDAVGDWTGFSDRLTPEARKKIKNIEAAVDLALAGRDRECLIIALHNFRDTCLHAHRKELQSWARPPLKRH